MNITPSSQPDSPTRLPPSLVKDLRQGMRAPAFMVLISIFPAAMALIFLLSFMTGFNDKPFIDPETCNGLFWSFLIFTMLVVIPMRGINAISEELQSLKSELLLLTRQTAAKFILGKGLSLISQSALILFISLPFALIRYYYGQVNPVEDLTLLFLIFGGSAMLTALCLWFAGMHKVVRIILAVGLVTSGFPLIIALLIDALLDSRSTTLNFFTDGFWPGMLLLGLITLNMWVVVRIFLAAARRWFAPQTENTFSTARKTALISWVPSVIMVWFIGGAGNFMEGVIAFQMLTSIITSVGLVLLDMTTPSWLQPVLLEQMRDKKLRGLQWRLFTPGMYPAMLFSILVAALTAYLVIVSEYTDSGTPEHLRTILGWIAAWWYALVIIPLCLQAAWRKLGNMTLIIVLIIGSVCAGFVSILAVGDAFLPIVPVGTIAGMANARSSGDFYKYVLPMFHVLNIAFAFLIMYLNNGAWFKTFKDYKKSLKGAPKESLKAAQE